MFQRDIRCRHAICVRTGMATSDQRPDSGAEPAPAFASDSEIELAARLRRQLESRYLADEMPPIPASKPAGDVR